MIWGGADVIIIQKVHSKCNALESSWNNLPRPPSLPGPWKNCPPWNQSLVPKRLGTTDLEVLNGTSEYFLFQLFYCTCINISHTSFFYKNWIILGILFGKIFCLGGFFFSFGLAQLDLYLVTCMKIIIILTSSPWWTCFTTINNVAISTFLHMSFSATLNIFIL